MSLLTNEENVQFATELAVDKIIGVYVDSFNAATQTTNLGGAGSLFAHAIPHSFTRPVFCELLWSTDGVTYADGGSGILSSTRGIAFADSNNIYVATGLNSGTIYYKVIASWIDDYDTTNPLITPVLNTTNNFYFDSRKNYPKIYKQDSQTLSSASGTLSYIHALGYSPNFKVFFESVAGQVWPAFAGSDFIYDALNQYTCQSYSSPSILSMGLFGGGGSSSCRVWYRVYVDQ